MTLLAAELFAGVGGFRLGLEMSGLKVIWSNQWEPGQSYQWASKVYEERFGSNCHVNRDIKLVLDDFDRDTNMIPEFDLLVGGFPCQDYSVAKSLSTSEGLEGKKGVLWWEIHRLISMRRPSYVLLENVDRLVSSPANQRGRDFAIMLSSLASLGYDTSWRVINAADYGHPQKRKRIYIFAQIRGNSVDVFENSFPSHKDSTSSYFELDPNLLYLTDFFNLFGKATPFLAAGKTQGTQVETWKLSPIVSEITPLSNILQGFSEVPEEFIIPTDQIPKWEFLKGGKAISRVGRDGFEYRYSEGKMAFPDRLDRPARTIVTGEGGISPSRFKHVVEQNKHLRRLTPVELERANEFPDDWTKFSRGGVEVPPTRRAFLMGNALVVGVIAKLAAELRKNHEAQRDR